MRRFAGILNAKTGADGRGERHDRAAPRQSALRAAIKSSFVYGRTTNPSFTNTRVASMSCSVSGNKCLLVADDFELDPVRKTDFAREPRGANRFIGGVASGGVRQDKDLFAVDVIEQRLFAAIGEVHTADGNGDHVRAARGVRASHLLKTAVLPGSDDQSGVEGATRITKLSGMADLN